MKIKALQSSTHSSKLNQSRSALFHASEVLSEKEGRKEGRGDYRRHGHEHRTAILIDDLSLNPPMPGTLSRPTVAFPRAALEEGPSRRETATWRRNSRGGGGGNGGRNEIRVGGCRIIINWSFLPDIRAPLCLRPPYYPAFRRPLPPKNIRISGVK